MRLRRLEELIDWNESPSRNLHPRILQSERVTLRLSPDCVEQCVADDVLAAVQLHANLLAAVLNAHVLHLLAKQKLKEEKCRQKSMREVRG